MIKYTPCILSFVFISALCNLGLLLREQREKDNEFILEIVFQSLTCHFLIQFQEYCIEIVDVSVAFTKGSNGSLTTYSEGSLGTGVVILPSCVRVCLMT